MIRHLLAASALFAFGLAQAGPPEAAPEAQSIAKPGRAAALLEFLAQAGNATAQLRLGSLYFKGIGVGQDYEKALYWARKSAEQGNVDAMYLTGSALLYAPLAGKDGEAAAREAAAWFARASRYGHVEAQYALGLLYYTGKGVHEDRAQAIRWFRRAASGGKKEAMPFVAKAPPMALLR